MLHAKVCIINQQHRVCVNEIIFFWRCNTKQLDMTKIWVYMEEFYPNVLFNLHWCVAHGSKISNNALL